ncbi:hypothetical protein N7532_011927 [Penicillium argentinense]|uniref:Ribosomal protein/NADH dehydrogenase domain-containing protein n=1 Tax=Penicillium argentinense TaxID=1131581 RepID=A0A9W9EJH6_9EURO|nr:uncharacterized protein N7532_011927 [Penicillium argentinense]KAJ5082884.1 hypothetical protein N7532_011927 [Penicillium argentinense]
MVNLFKRMRKLKTMLDIRVGTGAAILPSVANASKEFPAVTRLHLTYAQKIYGADNRAGPPPALTIYFADRIGSTATAIAGAKKITDKHAPAPANGEKMATVNIKDLTYQEIWNRVQASTGAEEIPVSEEDKAEAQKFEDMNTKAVKDRERIQAKRQAKKDQERMLAEARGEVEKLQAA